MDTGIPYAIIGPTLDLGAGDRLLNDFAWQLRRFSVFGSGDYKIQSSYPEDLATQGANRMLRAHERDVAGMGRGLSRQKSGGWGQ